MREPARATFHDALIADSSMVVGTPAAVAAMVSESTNVVPE